MLRYIIIPIKYYILPKKYLKVLKTFCQTGLRWMMTELCAAWVWILKSISDCSRPFVLWGIFLEDKRTTQCQQWYKISKTESQTFAKLKEQGVWTHFESDIIRKFWLKHSFRRKGHGHIICIFLSSMALFSLLSDLWNENTE